MSEINLQILYTTIIVNTFMPFLNNQFLWLMNQINNQKHGGTLIN